MTSTTIEERIRLRMRGGPPWGFRVEGGGSGPVYISSLRQRSSGKEQQIMLGDEVISINDRSMQGLAGDVAMAIVEHSVGILELEILRKRHEDGPGTDFTSSAYSHPKIQSPQPTYQQPQVYQPPQQPTYQQQSYQNQPYQNSYPQTYQPHDIYQNPSHSPRQPSYQSQPGHQTVPYQEPLSHVVSTMNSHVIQPKQNTEHRSPTTVQMSETGSNHSGGGLTVKKKTTTTTRVLTKSGGDKSERTVTKTVTERVGNVETTTTTKETQLNDGYGEEIGPKSVVRETRYTDKPIEDLMEIAPGYTEEYDPTDGRRKIILTQPTVWSPHVSPKIPTYQGDAHSPRGITPVQRTGKPYGASPSHTPSSSYIPSPSYESSPAFTPSYKASPGGLPYAKVTPPVPTQSLSRTSYRPHYLPPMDVHEGPLAPTYQQPAQTYPARSSTLPRQGQTAGAGIPTSHGLPSQSRGYPQYGTFPRTSEQSLKPSVQAQRQPHAYSPTSSYSPKPKVIQIPVTNQLQGVPQSGNFGQRKSPTPIRAKPGIATPGFTPQVHQKPTRFIPPGSFSPNSGVIHTPTSSHQGLLTTVKPNGYGSSDIQHKFISQPTHVGNKYPGAQVGKPQSPYKIQTSVQARPGQTTSMPMLTNIQPQPGKIPPPTQPKYTPIVSPKVSPKPVYSPLAFKGTAKESTDIAKPMKAETHSGPQHAIVQAPKQQPKVKTFVLPPSVTPGQEISMSFDVPGLARGDDNYSQDSGVPNTPSPDVGAQFERSIIPTMEVEEDGVLMDEEREDPLKKVTPGFVKSQRKKRDLKSKSDRKHKAVVQRAKSFHGLPTRDRGAIEEHSVKAQDKQKAAKTIADILMFPMDKKLKGARMFAKQRKRSAKYTKETMGMNYDADYDEEELEEMYDDGKYGGEYDETFDPLQRQKSLPAGAVAIPGMDNTAMDNNDAPAAPPPPPMAPPPPPPPPPPPLPPGGIKYNWRGRDIEATNFNVDLKSKTKCEHKTPDQYKNLVKDMTSQAGRGAQMFARLRERSEQFVLDENTAKLPKQQPPTVKSTSLPVNSTLAQTSNDVSLSYIASQSHQQTDSRQPQWTKKTPPWEAQRKKRPVAPPPVKPKPKVPLPTSNTDQDMERFQAIKYSPSGSPAGGNTPTNYNAKPQGWNSPRNSIDYTPTSPQSVESGNAGDFQSQPLVQDQQRKGSDGFADFNARPKGFHPSNYTPRAGMVE